MGYSSYDADPRLARQMEIYAPTSTGLSVPGTAAADTVLLRLPFSDAITVSGSARVRLTTGGTAAGPNVTFGKSLAGTGASRCIRNVGFRDRCQWRNGLGQHWRAPTSQLVTSWFCPTLRGPQRLHRSLSFVWLQHTTRLTHERST
jgi:hypothetical protein